MLSVRFFSVASRTWPALVAALLWALVTASAVLWWLHFPQAAEPAAGLPGVAFVSATTPQAAAVERALGQLGTRPAPELQSRFQLLGVIAATSGQGSALIAVDGQAPKAYVLGQVQEGGWLIRAVTPRSALIESQGQKFELVLAGSKSD